MELAGVVALGLLIDALVFIYRPPNPFAIVLAVNVSILVGLIFDLALRQGRHRAQVDLFRRL
jgi:hypothetical protein